MKMKEFVKTMQEPLGEIVGEKVNQDKTKAIINAVFETIGDVIATGESVDVLGFGKFETAQHASRKGVNPNTKEEIVIPAMIAPKLRPAKALKDKVNGR